VASFLELFENLWTRFAVREHRCHRHVCCDAAGCLGEHLLVFFSAGIADGFEVNRPALRGTGQKPSGGVGHDGQEGERSVDELR
jgi:hypothetical protein